MESTFRPQDEPLVLRALAGRERLRLRISGRGRFAEDGGLEAVEQVQSLELEEARSGSAVHAAAPERAEAEPEQFPQDLWDTIEGLVAALPPEVVESLPEDGSEHHDHYIHGTRKRAS